VRWIPLLAIFLYVYIEISIFIQVAHVFGVLLTLILVIFTSVIGMSLVRNQGFKNFLLMQQKMAAGESPAAEMVKSVSLIPRPVAACSASAKAPDAETDAASALQPDAGRWIQRRNGRWRDV
jgi:UPF0716 family protein affecting phage T7 exclusion